jgi:hypothetical protein
VEAATERDGRGVRKFCENLAVHLNSSFGFCKEISHPDFDPVYMAAMFLDPYFSQMLSVNKEEEAMDYLKAEVRQKDVEQRASAATAGTSTSTADNNASDSPTPSTSSATGSGGTPDHEDGPSLPKQVHLFKFLKVCCPSVSEPFLRI